MTKWDESGKYIKVKCPECRSIRKEKLINNNFTIIFANPRGTSKADSPTYAGDYNLEMARDQRRTAETHSHVGPNPYPKFKD